MKKISNFYTIAKYLSYFTQVGLSMVVPLIIWVMLASWTQRKFQLGGWVMLVGIFLGMYSAGYCLFQFFRYMQREAREGEKKHKEL